MGPSRRTRRHRYRRRYGERDQLRPSAFSRSDIGLNKAAVLVNRVNIFWGLDWEARPESLDEKTLRNPDRTADIVIGCVDTRAARQTIQVVVTGTSSVSYWLDLGNNAASGQYVLGQPLNSLNRRKFNRLRTVAELYPEISDTSSGEIHCPAVRPRKPLSARSRSLIKRWLRAPWPCCLAYFGWAHRTPWAFYNAASGRMSSMPVDPDRWKKSRRCFVVAPGKVRT